MKQIEADSREYAPSSLGVIGARRSGAYVSFLSQVPLFSQLSEPDLRLLAEACRVRTYRPGEVLFHDGDSGDTLFILLSGQVKILMVGPNSEESILDTLTAGECLGELSLVDGGPRSAMAQARDRVETLVLRREDFLSLMERHPPVALGVARRLAGMVRRLNEQVQDGILLDVPARIAKKLLELADRHGRATPQGIHIPLRITQHELAQMVGAARETVAKQLSRLQARGILTHDRSGITLHQPESLRERIY
jgi:CRP-like cAMP-binding protein